MDRSTKGPRYRTHRLTAVVAALLVGISLAASPAEALAAPRAPDAERDPSLKPARVGFFEAGSSYETHRAGFSLNVAGERVVHRVFAITALPGDALAINIDGGSDGADYQLRYGAGEVRLSGSRAWEWRAPDEPGVYPLRIDAGSGDFVHLNVLVMHDREHVTGGDLHGYAIGAYRSEPLRGDPAYLPPEGFVEAVAGYEDVLVSPHFTLAQFLCKQPGERRFLAISTPLVRKLETVLEAVNDAGISTRSFHVMSGFRTPAYNASIGNKTVYSRHLWGDAADIYVDVDGNRQMDDLNGDGRSDVEDARVLYGIVEGIERGDDAIQDGGLGLYRRNAAHGPFVHVDARGQSVRW